MRLPFTPLEHVYDEYDPSLTYISSDMVFFLKPVLAFSQWIPTPFIMDVVEYHCNEQLMMASKAHRFDDDTAFSSIFASDDSREQKRLGR